MGLLNLVKPITAAQKRMAVKCRWNNIDDIPVRKNILPGNFAGTAKPEPDVLTISTKLNTNNITVMETITGNDKLLNSTFVRTNMSEILEFSKTEDGTKLMQAILTPDNIEKIEAQKLLIKRHPRIYIKDKINAKYMSTPAGINALFNNISILKAAEVLDKNAFNELFKMDITQGLGKNLLNSIGQLNQKQIEKVKESSSGLKPLMKILVSSFGKIFV